MHRLLALLLLPAIVDCGSTCEDIARDRAAFASKKRVPHGPDARLSLPFATLDPVLAQQLARRPPVRFELPLAQLGLDLALSARLDGVHAAEAPAGKLGVRADIGLYDGDARIMTATVATNITPTFRKGTTPALVLTLEGSDLGDVDPRTTPESRTRLSKWLREKLPRAAKVFANDELLGLASDELLGLFARELWPTIKGPLLGTRELFTTVVNLPEMPLANVSVRSFERMLQVDLVTDLPLDHFEPLPDRRATRLNLLVAGPTAAALVNEAMDRGLVPSRFTSAGKPRADGPYEARIGWGDGARPLRVHLWQPDAKRGACRSAVMAGTLAARVERDELVVEVQDGRVGSVRGDAMTEAFAWLHALWSDAIEAVFRVASVMSFGTDEQAIQLRVRDVRIDERTLSLELEAR